MRFLSLLAAVAAFMLGSFAQAETNQSKFPDRPVKIVVPAAAGGQTDVLARALGQGLSTIWGQPVIVDNRPGANQIIGADLVAKSPGDGYTLFLSDSATFVINPYIYKKLPYDAGKDFTYISTIAEATPVIVVPTSLNVDSLTQLLEKARANPGGLFFASTGAGSYGHVAGEYLNHLAGIKLVHVPFKGGGPQILQELAAGRISVFIGHPTVPMAQMTATGMLRFIAAATPRRLAAYPNLPTASESGVPGFEVSTWFGVVAPAHLPEPLLSKIHADIARVIQSPEYRTSTLAPYKLELMSQSPAQFRELIKSDMQRWKKLVAISGASVE